MPAGQPPKFETADELQDAIDDYFKNGVKEKEVIIGSIKNQTIATILVPTITGLVLHIGFDSRQSFYDYEKIDKFSYTIKRARTFIEMEYEERLQSGNPTGAIFALKNFNWKDRQEIGIGGEEEGTPLAIKIIRGDGPASNGSL
ncbi:hypothetical protein LCGC14_0418190 [marine sediment metagenome]|uniref:Uncharacterized protein n=1 Tax=marine sediment metagenome TaxID=412755 RepID=A0A0F9W106_9ZZZZ